MLHRPLLLVRYHKHPPLYEDDGLPPDVGSNARGGIQKYCLSELNLLLGGHIKLLNYFNVV